MELKILYEIWDKWRNVFSSDKIYPLWRFILCFFSADFFIKFNYKWISDLQDITSTNNRTLEILYFIGTFILIRFIFYSLFEIPLRLIFHGYVKKKVLLIRDLLNQGSKWDKKRNVSEFLTTITPFFHKYLFKYGILSSNDLNEPIDFDFTSREQEFNDGMSVLYRWNLTIIHTLLVAIIVWKFYAVWFFIIVLLALIVSIILALAFTFLILNLDYLETIRLQLLKENKKNWR